VLPRGWAYDGGGNRTHEVEGNALRLAAIGGANRLDQIGGAGAALIEGTVSELANVTVNGQAATVRALPGGSPYLFSKELALAAGTHQITVNAQDQANNTTLRRYNVTVGGTERTLTYDTNGNLTEERVIGGSTRTYRKRLMETIYSSPLFPAKVRRVQTPNRF
jgi:YD repeat-containing protein